MGSMGFGMWTDCLCSEERDHDDGDEDEWSEFAVVVPPNAGASFCHRVSDAGWRSVGLRDD